MTSDCIGYHKQYRLSVDNSLIEVSASSMPEKGTIAAQIADLHQRQVSLNARLAALAFGTHLRNTEPVQAGIYPLKVTEFTCSCECQDEDGMCEQLTARLGNLKIITEVPFMRKGNVIFAIRSQGLVDPTTGRAESVDALFNGGIYWTGTLDPAKYDYDLLMFRTDRDRCVGKMTESIDLTRRVGEIDPGIYQTEVAYHLETESNGVDDQPTLSRVLSEYCSAEELEEVAQCYLASAAFAVAASGERADLTGLAEAARKACAAVPGKRYYQAYEAYLQGFVYSPK